MKLEFKMKAQNFYQICVITKVIENIDYHQESNASGQINVKKKPR